MIESLLNTMLELSPWFLLGMGVAGLLHGLLPRNFVKQQLRGRFAVLKAVALGVPLPLCSCGVIPAGLGLKRDGASNGASLGFLISTPQTGVDSILVSSAFLGWPFAIFKVLAAAITGVVGGWIADRLPRDEAWQADLGESETEADQSPRGPRAMVVHAHDLLASIWRWLVFGVVVSALINTFLPVGSLEVFENAGPLLAGFLVLLISLPLYVCATASVPIAAALVAGGMPVGAALVFLMAGPATNVATIGAIYRGFGGRQLAAYLAVLIVGSVGFGVIFDLSIGSLAVQQHFHGEAHRTWWAIASAVLLTALIARLAALDLLRVIRGRLGEASAATLEVAVEGLSCGACERKVEKALLAVDGVARAVVSRDPGRAVISGSAD
ncbi:MAG: permease, partial [Myxococcota bacterium]|nr:permease [Myxococcota bacterium]